MKKLFWFSISSLVIIAVGLILVWLTHDDSSLKYSTNISDYFSISKEGAHNYYKIIEINNHPAKATILSIGYLKKRHKENEVLLDNYIQDNEEEIRSHYKKYLTDITNLGLIAQKGPIEQYGEELKITPQNRLWEIGYVIRMRLHLQNLRQNGSFDYMPIIDCYLAATSMTKHSKTRKAYSDHLSFMSLLEDSLDSSINQMNNEEKIQLLEVLEKPIDPNALFRNLVYARYCKFAELDYQELKSYRKNPWLTPEKRLTPILFSKNRSLNLYGDHLVDVLQLNEKGRLIDIKVMQDAFFEELIHFHPKNYSGRIILSEYIPEYYNLSKDIKRIVHEREALKEKVEQSLAHTSQKKVPQP